MRAAIAKRYTFRGTHSLPNHPSPELNQPHDHDYTVEVVVEGDAVEAPGQPDENMVVDDALIDIAIQGALDELASDVNGVLERDEYGPSTVEAIAAYLLDFVHSGGVKASEVTVWEDDVRWGRVRPAQ